MAPFTFAVNRAKLGVLFFFFRWGLRVIYNSDIFEELGPSPWAPNIPKLKLGLLRLFACLGSYSRIFSHFFGRLPLWAHGENPSPASRSSSK